MKTYEAIVKGENIPTPGTPESFKVLVKELQSLCLDIRVLDKNGDEIELSSAEEEEAPGQYVNAEDLGPVVDDEENVGQLDSDFDETDDFYTADGEEDDDLLFDAEDMDEE